MASVNKVILVGNLGRDPEMRYTADGNTAICNITMATSRRYRDSQGVVQEDTEWHRVVFFGRQAEIASTYLRKGSQVYVEGRLRTRRYTGKDGIERYQTEIISETMQLLGSRSQGDSQSQAQSSGDGFESPRRPPRQPYGQNRQPYDQQRQAPRGPAPQQPEQEAPKPSSVADLPDEDIPF